MSSKKVSNRRFSMFTDAELYMLKRQAVESSFEIVMVPENKYTEAEKDMHCGLLSEIIVEIKQRELIK